eukprot:5263633-Karenia_brevis.AAC.1
MQAIDDLSCVERADFAKAGHDTPVLIDASTQLDAKDFNSQGQGRTHCGPLPQPAADSQQCEPLPGNAS